MTQVANRRTRCNACNKTGFAGSVGRGAVRARPQPARSKLHILADIVPGKGPVTEKSLQRTSQSSSPLGNTSTPVELLTHLAPDRNKDVRACGGAPAYPG